LLRLHAASGLVDDHVVGVTAARSWKVEQSAFSLRPWARDNQFVPFPTGRRAYEEHGVWRGDATKHRPTNFTAPLHVCASWPKSAAGP